MVEALSALNALLFASGCEYSFSVKGLPGTMQDGGATFATTHWSVVAARVRE
jgi:hypothetical protein